MPWVRPGLAQRTAAWRDGDKTDDRSVSVRVRLFTLEVKAIVSLGIGVLLLEIGRSAPDTAAETLVLRHSAAVVSVAYSPDGRTIASADAGGSVVFWDATSGEGRGRFHDQPSQLKSVRFSPDGTMLAVIRLSGMLRLKDTPSGVDRPALAGFPRELRTVAFSPDGMLVAAASFNRDPVRIWNWRTSRVHSGLNGCRSASALAFRSDGQVLASAGMDGRVRVWDLATGVELIAFQAQGTPIVALAYTPDDRHLLSTSPLDPLIRFWDPATGDAWATIHSHGTGVNAVAFSPDASLLATGGMDGSVRLWDAVDHRQRARLRDHHGPIWSLSFSPDGTSLASAGVDGTVRVRSVAAALGSFSAASEAL